MGISHYEKDDNFIALFKPSLKDFNILYSCLKVAAGWKSATYFYRNEIISRTQMLNPVECIVNLKELAGQPEACLTEDTIYGYWLDNGIRNNKKFIIPCKQARSFGYRKVGENYRKMFLVEAQEQGVTMCPFFNMACFKGPFDHKDDLNDLNITINFEDIMNNTDTNTPKNTDKEPKKSFFSKMLGIFKK